MKSEPPARRPVGPIPTSERATAKLSFLGLFAILILLPTLVGASAETSLGPTPDSAWLPTLAIILVLIVLNGGFVACQAALDGTKPSRIRAGNGKHSRRILAMLDQKERYVAACMLASQTLRAWMMILCFVPAPSLAHAFALSQGRADEWSMILLAGVVLTIPVAALNVVFGELVPRSFASSHPEQVLGWFARPIRAVGALFGPVIALLSGIANLFSKRFGARAEFSNVNFAEEEIKSLMESATETGQMDTEQEEMIHSVFEFGDTVAREVMTPRVDVDAAPETIEPNDLVALIQQSGHSRIPLYRGTDDHIVGVIHAKDLMSMLLKNPEGVSLRQIMRPALFVAESTPVQDLLTQMKAAKTQIAIVKDEHDGTSGVVTIEDIVEELVGEIQDEYDVEESKVQTTGEGWVVDGLTNLYDLNEEIESAFESEEFDTLGGYVFGLFGKIPDRGETLYHEGYRFTVVELDGRRIGRVRIERIEASESILDDILA